MKVGEYCKRQVIWIEPGADLQEAARVMRDRHVGFLVVAEPRGSQCVPVGVITDRDIVVAIDAAGVDPRSVTVGDAMTDDPVVASESDDFDELIRGMRMAGIRRVPVVDAQGNLSGVIAADDVIEALTGWLAELCGAFRNEQRHERRLRG
ncbi:MAG: CBS domain-containing protein [Proteobacteria bacterium]|nr:MAG: CBS domain-containing protein [Pseudomonadota bacterium]